ncbi:MAG TPA: HAMP domain-containing protein, partial [Gaiellaceae bacterium]
MTLRLRLVLVAAGVVAVVVGLACATTYFVMRHELYSQVDDQLAVHALHPSATYGDFSPQHPDYVEYVYTDGVRQGVNIPVDDEIRAVAAGTSRGFSRNTSARLRSGQPILLRERVRPYGTGAAVVVAANIDYIDHDLDRLRFILILVSLGAIAAAAGAGAVVSGATLAPVRRLTAAAERIAETGEPSERVPEGGKDELAALGASFNTMLAALEESLETQRRF